MNQALEEERPDEDVRQDKLTGDKVGDIAGNSPQGGSSCPPENARPGACGEDLRCSPKPSTVLAGATSHKEFLGHLEDHASDVQMAKGDEPIKIAPRPRRSGRLVRAVEGVNGEAQSQSVEPSNEPVTEDTVNEPGRSVGSKGKRRKRGETEDLEPDDLEVLRMQSGLQSKGAGSSSRKNGAQRTGGSNIGTKESGKKRTPANASKRQKRA
ncbi:hypothetical protein RhiJN_24351 [Ceratobasidium sp. AG-Ba]|nr:hypothetical protein RhiJN_24351 [Ceratobasidium sp. AG-Ba]